MKCIDDARWDAVATEHLMQLAHWGIPRVIRGDVLIIVIRVLRFVPPSPCGPRRLRGWLRLSNRLRLSGRRRRRLPLRRKKGCKECVDVDTHDLLGEPGLGQNAGRRLRVSMRRGLSGGCGGSSSGVHVGQSRRSSYLVRSWHRNAGRTRRRKRSARVHSSGMHVVECRIVLISIILRSVSHVDRVTIDVGVRDDPSVNLHRR